MSKEQLPTSPKEARFPQMQLSSPEIPVRRLVAEMPQTDSERLLHASNIFSDPAKMVLVLLGEGNPDMVDVEEAAEEIVIRRGRKNDARHRDTEKKHLSRKILTDLVPHALVAVDVTLDDKVIGYTLTPFAREYVIPAIKGLLKETGPVSDALRTILGTNSGRKGSEVAAYHRIRLFLYMLEHQNDPKGIRLKDLTNCTGVTDHAISTYLRRMAHPYFGYVKYNFADPEKRSPEQQVQYRFNPDYIVEHTMVENQRRLTNIIYTIAREHPGINLATDDFAQFLLKDQRWNRVKTRNISKLKKRLGKVLSGLSNQGVLQRNEFHGKIKQSDASLTDKGGLLSGLFTQVATALSDTPQGVRLRAEWDRLPWEKSLSIAFQKHMELTFTSWDEQESFVLHYFYVHGQSSEGIRPMQVKEAFRIEYPNKISESRVGEILRKLSQIAGEKGIPPRLRKEKRGKASLYFLT